MGQEGLQIEATLWISNRGKKITNRGRDFKSGQRDFKSGQRLQIRARRIWNRADIANQCRALRTDLSHLNENKFKHSYCDFFSPLCACNLEAETTSHYLLRYHLFQRERRTLLNDIKEIDENIITDHKNDLDQILLYGNGRYRYDTNRIILLSTIKFCVDSKRFDLLLL